MSLHPPEKREEIGGTDVAHHPILEPFQKQKVNTSLLGVPCVGFEVAKIEIGVGFVVVYGTGPGS